MGKLIGGPLDGQECDSVADYVQYPFIPDPVKYIENPRGEQVPLYEKLLYCRQVLPDGSVVYNFVEDGMMKIVVIDK